MKMKMALGDACRGSGICKSSCLGLGEHPEWITIIWKPISFEDDAILFIFQNLQFAYKVTVTPKVTYLILY